MHRIALFFVLTVSAVAAPPPGTDLDGPTHAWFAAQHAVNGVWCCDVSDGHLLADDAWRAGEGAYEVLIGGRWYRVPPGALRDPKGGPNPTGHAIVWYAAGAYGVHIFCFAPGFQF